MTKKRTRPVTPKKKTVKAAGTKATLPAASDVLRKHAERLRKRGAHAMSIKPGTRGPVIEVFVPEDFTGTLPSKIGATVKGKPVDVPIKMRKAPRFKAEKL
jgi:hypothetical protein